MATTVTRLIDPSRFTAWFVDFLRQELAPYPGRGPIVARMVISATISMILIVTFRIPGGAIGVLSAFILSRENLVSTARSAFNIVLAFALAGLFIPLGARFFAAEPITHFLWEAVSLFLVFFLLRTLTNFAVATSLSLVATNILSIWYLPGPANRNVELTLWQVASALIGALVTLAVEVVFHAFNKHDELIVGLDSRLQPVEELMLSYASGQPPAPATEAILSQYAMVGMGSLRRYVARASYEPIQKMRMSTVVSLTGRSVDFSTALASTYPQLATDQRHRAGALAKHIAEIRSSLATGSKPSVWQAEEHQAAGTPFLSELESMIALITAAFESQPSIDPRFAVLDTPPATSGIFVPDAFTNPEHLRFVLSGTLAAMLCYIFYVALGWPGISTSVTTCVLTALTNIGASRQKQVLRVAGAMLGGFVFGLGAQVFILPNIDSISGFAVLFATVSAVAAWVATSSSRLSYAGLQIALAFYLINLSEFSIQTSLKVARDRSIGVLLGTFMMWLVFERIYPKPAVDEMVRIFIENLRLMADLIHKTDFNLNEDEIIAVRRQRDQIYRHFGDVNAQADAVPFETGPTRPSHMAARDRIRRWQASLRTFYLLQVPLIQLRAYGTHETISPPFLKIEDHFRDECAIALESIANCLEVQLRQQPGNGYTFPPTHNLRTMLEFADADEQTLLSPREEALLRMARTIATIMDKLETDIASEPLFAA